MSAPDDLTPQEPGAIATDDQEPPMDASGDDMQALTEGTVEVIADTIPALTDEELQSLAVYEQHGKGRKGVLDAIEQELAGRAKQPEPAPAPKTAQGVPSKFARPILTEAGWVVPEPHQLPDA